MNIRYRLYKDVRPELTPLQQVLYNRNVDVDKQAAWIGAGWESVNDWALLDDDFKLTLGINMVKGCVERGEDILVVVDADSDGSNSASLFINYLYAIYPKYVKSHVSWVMHKGKQHGLADIVDEILAAEPSLVVSPDGGRL